MAGPYFPGQIASSCGHFYPDVLRLRDEKRPDGSYVRIVDCTVCGRLEYALYPATLSPELVQTLDQEGFQGRSEHEDLAKIRKAAMKQMQSRK